MLFYYINFV